MVYARVIQRSGDILVNILLSAWLHCIYLALQTNDDNDDDGDDDDNDDGDDDNNNNLCSLYNSA